MVPRGGEATDKRFLALFFKKEHAFLIRRPLRQDLPDALGRRDGLVVHRHDAAHEIE